MNESTFVELDSFMVNMLRSVDTRRKNLDALLAQHDSDETQETISPTEEMPLSPTLSNNSENDFQEIPNEPEVTQHIRRSISALLNVNQKVIEDDDVIEENSEQFINLKQRLNKISTLYSDINETPKAVLNEKTNVEQKTDEPVNFKSRLNNIARMYYPVKPEPVQTSVAKVERTDDDENKPKETSKISELKKSLNTQFQQQSAPPPKEKVNSVQVPAKKGSVTNLKNMFEQKIDDQLKPKHEAAPELLSLKDKKRLFEKAIREETAASKKANEMYQKPKKRIVDWQPKNEGEERVEEPARKKSATTLPQIEAIQKIEAQPVEPQDVPNEPAFSEKSMSICSEDSSFIEEHHEEESVQVSRTINYSDDHLQDEEHEEVFEKAPLVEVIEDVQEEPTTAADCEAVDQAFEDIEPISCSNPREIIEDTIDITFSALDNDSDSLQRSSTKVNLSQEIDPPLGEITVQVDCPEKPPRTFAYQDNNKSPQSSPQIVDDMEEPPPMRTISFYRREQKLKKELAQSPGGSIDLPVHYLKQNLLPEQSETRGSFCAKYVEKIGSLREEIKEHNRILSETSTALNLCLTLNDPEFIDQRIEAERLSLISAEKRSACMNYSERCKSIIKHAEMYYPVLGPGSSQASVRISNVHIPFKNDFLVARSKGKLPTSFHFICLLSCNAVIYVSELRSSEENLGVDYLEFKFGVTFKDLPENFSIQVKLFCLELSKDLFAKEKKTTFRIKFGTSSLKAHKKLSPAKKHIHSSNFKLVGHFKLNLQTIKENLPFYRLSSETITTTIDGYVTMNVQTEVNHKVYAEGFFDIQEEETSFWNLRYFVLDGGCLRYWRFKDDMLAGKAPIGKIHLKKCINPELAILHGDQRQVCMRANTFVLMTVDSNAQKGELDNIQRLFISSQSKEDSKLFCTKLNQTLRNIRAWETDIERPFSSEKFARLLKSQQ